MRKTVIIAEAGVNHNGSLDLAKRLVDAAAEAGADYIKFQTFKAGKLVSRQAKKADYQLENLSGGDDSQYAMLKELELSEADHLELIEHCRKRGVNFFSTAFDLESIDFLSTLHLGFWKIPSGEITNFPYIKRIAQHGEPVILSTGMSTLDEILDAITVLNTYGVPKERITVLHCNTEYPTPYEDVHLRAMKTIAECFGVKVGYSDHTCGIEVSLAAVALGATVIEKHFTLDRNLPGPDHKASLEPQELKQMVESIRHIEAALGSKTKQVSPSEEKNIRVARKSLVAVRDIRKGEHFSEENITAKRPGNGISPMRWEEVIGKTAPRDFKADELIEL